MENAIKALEIAAGVLLGLMIMALVAYFFKSIGVLPEEEEDLMSSEQLAAFNEEYVVYNKSKMYGVDVLSCMNKVISNNEKYAQGGAFLEGNASLSDYKQRENYWINIKIKLNSNLKETLTTYCYNSSNKEVLATNVNLSINTTSGLSKLAAAITKVGDYTKFSSNMTINRQVMEESVDVFKNSGSYKDSKGYINLIYRQSDGNVSDMNQDIVNMLDKIQTLSGDQGSTALTFVAINKNSSTYTEWSRVIWETVLYDLKKRKFKCTDFTYNTTTGRVNEIAFEEISN